MLPGDAIYQEALVYIPVFNGDRRLQTLPFSRVYYCCCILQLSVFAVYIIKSKQSQCIYHATKNIFIWKYR